MANGTSGWLAFLLEPLQLARQKYASSTLTNTVVACRDMSPSQHKENFQVMRTHVQAETFT